MTRYSAACRVAAQDAAALRRTANYSPFAGVRCAAKRHRHVLKTMARRRSKSISSVRLSSECRFAIGADSRFRQAFPSDETRCEKHAVAARGHPWPQSGAALADLQLIRLAAMKRVRLVASQHLRSA